MRPPATPQLAKPTATGGGAHISYGNIFKEIYFYFILNILFKMPEKNFGERTTTIFIIPSLKNKQYSDNAHERRFNYHHKHRRQKDRQKHACPEAHGAECHRFYCFITFIQTFTHFVPFKYYSYVMIYNVLKRLPGPPRRGRRIFPTEIYYLL